MSSTNKKIKIFNTADTVVSIIVVAFLFVFAFSALMTNYLEDDTDSPNHTPGQTSSSETDVRGSSIYPTLYAKEVRAAAEKYGIEEERIYAVIKVESDFRKDCVSSVGAVGLMQMLPSTYKSQCERLGIKYYAEDLYDPAINIDICTYYLKRMYNMYNDWDHAHAAYNAGYGNVNKWLKNPEYVREGKLINDKIPFKETRNYVKKVNYYYMEYKLANVDK